MSLKSGDRLSTETNWAILNMKAVFCLTLLACIALTFGEECSDSAECTHVTCPENDYTLDCVRGDCTCTHNTATCATADDCSDVDGENCRRDWHCVDAMCRCGLGFGGEGGMGGGPGK